MVSAAHGHMSTCGQRQTYLGHLAPWRHKKEASDTERVGSDTNPSIRRSNLASVTIHCPLRAVRSWSAFMQLGAHVLNLSLCTTTVLPSLGNG